MGGIDSPKRMMMMMILYTIINRELVDVRKVVYRLLLHVWGTMNVTNDDGRLPAVVGGWMDGR